MSGKSIRVPNYQRAYSWETDLEDRNLKHVNMFLSDLQDYVDSKSTTPYYLGHFLFEERSKTEYAIIDGQQRLTTTVIFISALYKRLKEIRNVKNIEGLGVAWLVPYCNIIKQEHRYRFSTVDYDNQMFRDYVIDQTQKLELDQPLEDQKKWIEDTVSKQRIAAAFVFFCKAFADKTEDELKIIFEAIAKASCTTHIVENPSEAVQMFIFQNNRGKKPTNLEIIKALFMYNMHLYATSEEEKKDLISTITRRFEVIYKSISKIEKHVNEDNVLNYTINTYRNTLDEISSITFVDEELAKKNRIDFIKKFTEELESCFNLVSKFLEDAKSNFVYHSLLVSANRSLVFPFVIKALYNGMPQVELEKLARVLEQISLRARIIGTRANLVSRLNDCYKEMENCAKDVVIRIEWMKNIDGWFGYWNNEELYRVLNREIHSEIAKILLWKYENHLIQSGKAGYAPMRYNAITTPHLEHIAPRKENTEPDNGYCPYDDEFRNQYLERLGNYLLLSGSHNESLSNRRFQDKRDSYTQLQQQLEVQQMTLQDLCWNKEKISQRHAKIVDFLMQEL